MTDLLVRSIGRLVTNASGRPGDLGVVEDAAVAIRGGRVAWVGPDAGIPDDQRDLPGFDVDGRAVLPGFVDPHTHLVFGGDRAGEFGRRLRGESYEEILASGGGIHATVEATRAATPDDLVEQASARAWRMLEHGTTTVEIKSGYGLTAAHETRMLVAAVAVGERTPVDVVPTFLGAHVVDRGVEREDYVRRVVDEMLPAASMLAISCDVFCDRGAFGVDETRSILRAARELGLGTKLHAEQLSHTGAALLAAEVGALSADHLDHATAEDARALAGAGVVAVLLPAVSMSMRIAAPPARMFWDAGAVVALATDCNPGTAYVESMPLVVALACLEAGLTPEEAVWAATAGGAAALGLTDRGRVVEGAVGDLAVLDADDHVHLAYRPGGVRMAAVVKEGAVVVRDGRATRTAASGGGLLG
ncbi:MAG: imidazolonepropionase [Acidimicrobiia bacterium]|nr:imidazolonepropionase [Acidimicrobiia bacterium]